MSDAATMLPPTAPDLAKALDVLEERLFGLPVTDITKDPMTAPVELLDHFAWENSVDVWDSAWSEEVKRNVIALALEVHQYKGTPHAIALALAAFEVDTDFLEWWQPGGAEEGMGPGEFRVVATAGGALYAAGENAIDFQMVLAMNAMVKRAAPVSRRLIFAISETFQSEAYLAGGVRIVMTSSEEVVPAARPIETTTTAFARSGLRRDRASRVTHDIQGSET